MRLEPDNLGPGPAAEPAIALAVPERAAEPEAARSSVWRGLWDFLHDLSVAVLFCFFLLTFVAQAFRVEGTSMEPLLGDGERIIVNKFVYRFRSITRGDVVVFWYPPDPAVSFVKRVVALPGDRVELRAGRLVVNEVELAERYLPESFRSQDTMPPSEVPRGYYFVLGDHRRRSSDSRNWGLVPERYIYGRAAFRFWPLGRLGFVR